MPFLLTTLIFSLLGCRSTWADVHAATQLCSSPEVSAAAAAALCMRTTTSTPSHVSARAEKLMIRPVNIRRISGCYEGVKNS